MPHAVMVPVSALLEDLPLAVELPLSCIQGLCDNQEPEVPVGEDGLFQTVPKERLDKVYSLIYTNLVNTIKCRATQKPKDPATELEKEEQRKVTPWSRRFA